MSISLGTLRKLLELESYRLEELSQKRIMQAEVVAEIEQQIQDLMAEIDAEKQCAQNNLSISFSFSSYYANAKNKWNTLIYKMAEEQLILDTVIQELQAVYTRSKQYEHLIAQREKQEAMRTLKQEGATLDEFNIMKVRHRGETVAN